MLRQHKKYILIRKQSHRISRELSLVVMKYIVLGAAQFATKFLRFTVLYHIIMIYSLERTTQSRHSNYSYDNLVNAFSNLIRISCKVTHNR